MFLAGSNLLLLVPLIALDGLPAAVALAIFAATFVSAAFINYIVKWVDRDSIVSLRRVFGLIFASNILWMIPLAAGSLLSWFTHSTRPSLNEFILGAFLAWSFELLVINGTFLSSTIQSICVAVVQPGVTLLLASAFVLPASSVAVSVVISGFVLLGITTAFLLKFKTFKTEGAGINSLQTFQSFLKTWVSHKSANLEEYFARYSQDEPVETKIILADSTPRIAVVLPGVHPGPFFPVGSYNLSELIYSELRKLDIIPMVLHGVGGHERNLPTNELARQYASAIADAVEAESTEKKKIRSMRGPAREKLGQMSVTMLGFGNQVAAFLSNAPYNTDDLEPVIIEGALSAAREMEIEPMLVDSHNSIGGENAEPSKIGKDDWKQAFSRIQTNPEERFETGAAHSSELPRFDHGSDISDGGIAVLLFRRGASKSVLISADSNNAIVPLRQMISDELQKVGVGLIDVCTSDTHKSAARYMTDRGYHALGEESNLDMLIGTIKELEKLAEGRLAPGAVTTISSRHTLPLIGEKSLNDFASLTKETLRFTKAYASGAVASVLVISFLTLFF